MKFTALVVFAATALVSGSAAAQASSPPATMQPIANPPEKAMPMHHGKHHMMHHKMRHAAKAADTTAAAPPSK